jgi:hypothetical protein
MGRKNSQAEVDARIDFIMGCRAKGEKSTSVIMSGWMEQFPGLSEGQFQKDYQKAKGIIQEYFEKDIDILCSEVTKHLWDLYAKSLKLQDYRECRAVLKQITEVALDAIKAKPEAKAEKPKSTLMALRRKVQ